MKTIGIPRALLYYKYKDLWINFFKELDCKIIISNKTNKKILENGTKYGQDEACLSLKLYLGHVYELIDKVDFVLVPRIVSLKKHEKLCTNFSALYDLINNTFDTKIINYNIDLDKNIKEIDSFIEMGVLLGNSKQESKKAYLIAKKKEQDKFYEKIKKQDLNLKSPYPKILLAAHSYNIHDELIGKSISNYLEKNNIKVIYSDVYNSYRTDYESSFISNSIYWTYNKEIMGAVKHYKDYVDGIILISTFPCGPDSLTNEMINRKITDKPTITIIIDELNNDAGIITRLESFVDIINQRRMIKNG